MTAQRWDYMPPGWTVGAEAKKSDLLSQVLTADLIWRKLTAPQRELLLSAVAGYPVAPRRDVLRRMIDRGLVDKYLQPTEAGRLVVKWRLPAKGNGVSVKQDSK
jgi:hypothetical protein